MKFNIPLLNLQVQIINSIKPYRTIIPIGCDCHPSFFLKTLGAKKHSLPFDSMNIFPVDGLNYIAENFSNNLNLFDRNIINTGFHRYKSSHFANAEFFHESNSLLNQKGKKSLRKRISTLVDLRTSKSCSYLYCIPSSCLLSYKELHTFIDSVQRILSILKETDSLHVYIRYDETESENDTQCEALLAHLSGIENVIAVKFILKKQQFGVWGDKAGYQNLFKQLKLGMDRTVVLKLKKSKYNKPKVAISNDIIECLKRCLVQIEDHRFYCHPGLDIVGVFRAFFNNLKAGKIVQGGSTITQQLARNLMNDNRITLGRKLRELLKTIKIEYQFSKDQILNLYIENVYFGHNLKGFYAASNQYFRKQLKDLSLAECIILITMLRSPMYYLSHPEKLQRRFFHLNTILMETKCITWDQFALNQKISIVYSGSTFKMTNEGL